MKTVALATLSFAALMAIPALLLSSAAASRAAVNAGSLGLVATLFHAVPGIVLGVAALLIATALGKGSVQ